MILASHDRKMDLWLLATAKPLLAISPRGGGRPRLPGPPVGYDPLAVAPNKIHFRKAKPMAQVAKMLAKGQKIWEPRSHFRPQDRFLTLWSCCPLRGRCALSCGSSTFRTVQQQGDPLQPGSVQESRRVILQDS
jgi:hypothetical protein